MRIFEAEKGLLDAGIVFNRLGFLMDFPNDLQRGNAVNSLVSSGQTQSIVFTREQ